MDNFNSEFDLTEKVSVDAIAETLIRAADRIYKYHISIAFGQEPPEGFEAGNKDYQQKILDLVSPMVKEYQQTKQITATTAGSVIALLSKGKVTPSEALALLSIIKKKVDVEEDELALKLKKDLIKQLDREEINENKCKK